MHQSVEKTPKYRMCSKFHTQDLGSLGSLATNFSEPKASLFQYIARLMWSQFHLTPCQLWWEYLPRSSHRWSHIGWTSSSRLVSENASSYLPNDHGKKCLKPFDLMGFGAIPDLQRNPPHIKLLMHRGKSQPFPVKKKKCCSHPSFLQGKVAQI